MTASAETDVRTGTTYAEALAALTSSGQPLALAEEDTPRGRFRDFVNRPRTVRDLVAMSAAHGEREFAVQGDRRVTYAEWVQLVWGTAAALQEAGLRKGDRLAVLAHNSIDYVITVFAAASMGATAVTLNGWWAADELRYGLTDSGSRFLAVDDALHPRVADVLSDCPDLETVLVGPTTALDGPGPRRLRWEDVVRRADTPPDVAIDPDEPFAILYTSGTTGRSKGCITTHGGTVTQVMGILLHGAASMMSVGGGPVPTQQEGQSTVLLTSPLFHVAATHCSVCTGLAVGTRMVFTEGRFSPEQVLGLIEREHIDTWAAIPTMLQRVVTSPALHEHDTSSLKSVSFGGAPTAPGTMDRAREVFGLEQRMTNVYGMTETHGVAMACSGSDLAARPGSIGRPLPFVDAKVVDPAGDEVADGMAGELLLRGPTVTPGYWNRPDATAAAVRDGWLWTGDIAYRDADGYLYLVDRSKDMVIRGGENVYCVEIENCIGEHPDIDEAAVIGVPDEDLGERVKALVRVVDGRQVTAEDVRRHVASRLASFKVPEIVEFVDAPLPRNAAGKLLKNELRR
jgi:long-chain acyl-CoA synthetase